MNIGAEDEPATALTDQQRQHVSELLARLDRRSIVFVGIMGAGKTVIGRKLASILNLPFIDSDNEIETASRMSIPELFVTYGEPEFRALEQRVIARLLRGGPQILSTGGGAFMSEATRRAISKHAVSIWLNADIDTLMRRVSKRQNRPLLNTEDPRTTMQRLMDVRYPVYAQASIAVQSSEKAKDAVAIEVLTSLHQHLTSRDLVECSAKKDQP